MMKAFIVDRYGSKDGVRAGDMPDPELREDDVLVQIHAAGVNLLDAKIRDGEFKRFTTIASGRSRNALRSKKMPWRRSQKTSPWKKRLPSLWSA